MMNNADEISKKTLLFGYMAQEATSSRFSALINKMFKQNSDDAMMIPMNIREDDFYFTISNMKNSQLEGAIISSEYVSDTLELLDESSSFVKACGMCDIVFIRDKKLTGDIFTPRVLNEYLKDMGVRKVALLGVNHYAKAFSYLACGFEVSYFNDNLEELMEFTNRLELKDADLNRIAEGMQTDLSEYDIVIDFSDLKNLNMVTKFPKLSLDLKQKKEPSILRQKAKELGVEYVGYEELTQRFAEDGYRYIKKGKKR